MAFLVKTVSSDVTISELGFTISHPTTDLDLSLQFEPEELRDAESLTQAILSGTLEYRLTNQESYRSPASYDKDIFLAYELATTGASSDEFTGGASNPVDPLEFNFVGSFSVGVDSSFLMSGPRKVGVSKDETSLLEVNGSISINQNGAIETNGITQISVRSV